MAVLIENIDKPQHCIFCMFAMRINNGQTACQWFPCMEPVDDGNPPPPYCPIKEAVKIEDTSELIIEENGVFKSEGAIWKTEKKTKIKEY